MDSDQPRAFDPASVVKLDTAMVTTRAHPLRVRLLGMLRFDGPSTATRLARRVGESSGSTSNHLRQLELVGLVAEDVARGGERWWRAVHDMSNYDVPENPATKLWSSAPHASAS